MGTLKFVFIEECPQSEISINHNGDRLIQPGENLEISDKRAFLNGQFVPDEFNDDLVRLAQTESRNPHYLKRIY